MDAPTTILVVDDEPDTLGLIELTLQTSGYEVQTAPNGEQALDHLRERTFDLILLDIMMPGLTGFDVMKNLKDPLQISTPVVLLTATSSQEDRETGEKLGAAAFLVKPTTRGKLLDTIQSVLSGSEPNDAVD
jgi:DNA-binding response OmpR family regulator